MIFTSSHIWKISTVLLSFLFQRTFDWMDFGLRGIHEICFENCFLGKYFLHFFFFFCLLNINSCEIFILILSTNFTISTIGKVSFVKLYAFFLLKVLELCKFSFPIISFIFAFVSYRCHRFNYFCFRY